MTISRLGTTTRWSDVVVYKDTVYLVEVAANPDADVKTQTREILESIEKSLFRVGSSKEHLLMVTIYLTDISTIDEFNQVWDEWVPMDKAPSRACVEAKLANPAYKVELQVIAARI